MDQPGRLARRTRRAFAVGCCVVAGWSVAEPAFALPVFSRREHLGCPVCHTVFPQLDAVGRSYKENGYHFTDDDEVQITGDDLGSGIAIDKLPGLAFRIESVPVALGPDDAGDLVVTTTPLDDAELIGVGNSGRHWSYLTEVSSEAENAYVPEGNGLVQYRFARALSLYAGWTPAFSRDGYNSISESRRWDHAAHAASDYEGTIAVSMNSEGGWVGGYGRISKLFWNLATGPGPGVVDSVGEPLDYLGRVEVDLTKVLSVGGFVYSANVAGDDAVRVALDLNAIGSFGTVEALGMYDTLDRAVGLEAGWDVALPAGGAGVFLLPEGRVDLTSVGGALTVAPTIGFGVQRSSGRAFVEVTETFPSVDTSARLVVDAVF